MAVSPAVSRECLFFGLRRLGCLLFGDVFGHRLSVATLHYAPIHASAEVVTGGLLIFSPQLVALSGEQTAIEGYVTDSATGLPLPAIEITLSGFNNASEQTNDTGFYRFEGGSIWIPVSYVNSTLSNGFNSPLPRCRAL